tara:strand:- start:156 stop:1817 length:1662 start_codon:yes stop_codon:yes gene_type:complete
MSVIGIDYGNKTTKLCSFYNGVFKNINSETDGRVLPSLVVFDHNIRYFSDFAKSKQKRCIQQIVYNIKSKIHDDEYISYLTLDKKDTTKYMINGFKLAYMYLSYIHKYIRTKVRPDLYVHSFPDDYSPMELMNYRNILETNQKMVPSMKYLLVPESVAISLDYGLYRIANNEFREKKSVLFIDIGCSTISFYVVDYFEKSITISFQWSLKDCGSIQMDKLLLQYVLEHFKSKLDECGVEIEDDIVEKKMIKNIFIECESIRKNLNTSKEIRIYMDSLYRDYHLDVQMKREKYIEIIRSIVDKFKNTIEIIHKNFSFHSVEFVGAFSRFFVFKEIAQQFFKKIHTTLNLEESVSKGACIYGANFLPTYKNIDMDIKYKYGRSLFIRLNGKSQRFISENDYLPFATRIPLPRRECTIEIFEGENKIYHELLNMKHLFLSLKIGLDKIHHFVVEYMNENNKMSIQELNVYGIGDEVDNELIILERKLSQRDKDHVDKINLINHMEEKLFEQKRDEEVMNNKFKRKHVDDLLEWLENDSSNCSLEEIKEKYDEMVED